MTQPSRTVVIVGGGFSGTVVAANLLRLSQRGSLRVVLIDRHRLGRGLAYANRQHPYLLNVPAGRMSARSADPLDFLSYARSRMPAAGADDFLPRALYGEYLECVLHEAEIGAAPGVHLERIKGQVHRLEPSDERDAYRVRLSDGRWFAADEVVLALGNQPPVALPGTGAMVRAGAYIPDPWNSLPSFGPGETVLVVGTGLTMVDVVLAGARSARDARVHAISRHGLLPLPQSSLWQPDCSLDTRALIAAASCSARRLLRAVRDLADRTQREGHDWQAAIALVRHCAPELWQRLRLRERRRFLRHARAYWDVHRHRLPEQTHRELTQLRASGTLQIHAGRIARLESVAAGVRVSWHPRGADQLQELLVDRVINCTGPDSDPRRSPDPLLRALLSKGLATRDALGLGLRTGPLGALVDIDGRIATGLYYIGPMLRPAHWESTAVQELRTHAECLARHLASPLLHREPSWPSGTYASARLGVPRDAVRT
jgi:uncharacterized NAD(P)/FAD-binding protein YdhS